MAEEKLSGGAKSCHAQWTAKRGHLFGFWGLFLAIFSDAFAYGLFTALF